MDMLIRLIVYVLNVYWWMIFVCVILTWLPELQKNKVAELLSRLVDPFLVAFRKVIPSIGRIEIASLVTLALLQFAIRGLSQW